MTAERWRVGRKVGRTIYTVTGDDPDGDGVLIGVMDTRELAHLAAAAPEMRDALLSSVDAERAWLSAMKLAVEGGDQAEAVLSNAEATLRQWRARCDVALRKARAL